MWFAGEPANRIERDAGSSYPVGLPQGIAVVTPRGTFGAGAVRPGVTILHPISTSSPRRRSRFPGVTGFEPATPWRRSLLPQLLPQIFARECKTTHFSHVRPAPRFRASTRGKPQKRRGFIRCFGHETGIANEIRDQEVAGSNPVTPT
jgi:hypothetical protein